MRKLSYIPNEDDCGFYRCVGDDSEVDSYVVTHPKTRSILTNPNIHGGEFLKDIKEATEDVLGSYPKANSIEEAGNSKTTVHSTLRGGLNWGVMEALYNVFDISATHSMSSCQRKEITPGKFLTSQTAYKKTNIPDHAYIIFPDIIATATTSRKMLRAIADHAKENQCEINHLLILTIGADRTEDMAREVHNLMRSRFPGYSGTDVVYHEGIFTLAQEDTPVRIKKEGTDLIKADALLTPEYEAQLYGSNSFEFARNVLSPCVIGDGFERGNYIKGHFEELLKYWNEELTLADQGITLLEEMKDRWPQEGYDDMDILREVKSKQWEGVSEEAIRMIHYLHNDRWVDGFQDFAKTPNALRLVCNNQIEETKKMIQ